jgi:hypothetical protein
MTVTEALTYVGLRGQQPAFGHGGPVVVGIVAGDDTGALPTPSWLEHSGASYEWGYEGAGPHLLASAILLDRVGRDVGYEVSRAFMRDVVARLPHEFELSCDAVDGWLREHDLASA